MRYPWDIVGHTQQLEQLEKEIEADNLSHAYLFSGPPQSGKFRVARTFATLLQCPNGLCRMCKVCQLIASRSHPDTVFIEDDGESIKIEEVRELVRKTHLTSQGKRRIILIENIERMPVEAQNSFLKTLEEPPGNTLFLLTTSRLDEVLLTIQSRVRHTAFSTVDDDILRRYLVDVFGEKPEMDEMVNMAQGRPGLAITLIKDPVAFEHQKSLYHRIETFLRRNDLTGKFLFAKDIEKDPHEVSVFLDAFARYLRKLLFEYRQTPFHPLSNRFTLEELVNLFESLEKTRYFIDRNVNKKLALENFLLMTEKPV